MPRFFTLPLILAPTPTLVRHRGNYDIGMRSHDRGETAQTRIVPRLADTARERAEPAPIHLSAQPTGRAHGARAIETNGRARTSLILPNPVHRNRRASWLVARVVVQ